MLQLQMCFGMPQNVGRLIGVITINGKRIKGKFENKIANISNISV